LVFGNKKIPKGSEQFYFLPSSKINVPGRYQPSNSKRKKASKNQLFSNIGKNITLYDFFQLESHESLMNAKSLNIQFFIHLQQTVSKQIQDCTQHVKVKKGAIPI